MLHGENDDIMLEFLETYNHGSFEKKWQKNCQTQLADSALRHNDMWGSHVIMM